MILSLSLAMSPTPSVVGLAEEKDESSRLSKADKNVLWFTKLLSLEITECSEVGHT